MQPLAEAAIQLPKRKISSILKDAAKCAEAVNLVYVTNLDPGITRVRKGKEFEYHLKGRKITDDERFDIVISNTEGRLKYNDLIRSEYLPKHNNSAYEGDM